MMLLFRYIATEYTKMFLFCTFALLALLMTTRLEDIAHFASMGVPLPLILWFCFYQIPYIAPVVIPVASLIAAFITSQKLSINKEIVTIRASGFSIKQALSPIILISLFVAGMNFYFASEIATAALLKSRELQRDAKLINPISLIKNHHYVKQRDFALFGKQSEEVKNGIEDLTLLLYSSEKNGLQLLSAMKAEGEGDLIAFEKLALASHLPDDRNTLFLENVDSSTSNTLDLSVYLKKVINKANDDYLRMPLLLARISNLHQSGTSVKQLQAAYSEILRRISLGLSVIALTLGGATYGLTFERTPSYMPVIKMLSLAALFLIPFFLAKNVHTTPLIASLFYLLPPNAILIYCLFRLSRMERGA